MVHYFWQLVVVKRIRRVEGFVFKESIKIILKQKLFAPGRSPSPRSEGLPQSRRFTRSTSPVERKFSTSILPSPFKRTTTRDATRKKKNLRAQTDEHERRVARARARAELRVQKARARARAHAHYRRTYSCTQSHTPVGISSTASTAKRPNRLNPRHTPPHLMVSGLLTREVSVGKECGRFRELRRCSAVEGDGCVCVKRVPFRV